MAFFVVDIAELPSSSVAGRVASAHRALAVAVAACRVRAADARRTAAAPLPIVVESPLEFLPGECIAAEDVVRAYDRDGVCVLANASSLSPREQPDPAARAAPRRSPRMSAYRTLDDGPTTEFSVQRVKLTRKRADAAARIGRDADYAHLRKARPADEPLPVTFKWIARLPAEVRPLALLRGYPRVANALALAWRDPATFRACLYDLLVDKRGDRKGFPADVVADLLALRTWFEQSCL